LLESNPLLARSIRHRFPDLDPLNHMQIELLKRYRAGDTDAPPEDRLREAISFAAGPVLHVCHIDNAPESSRPINEVTRQAILDWLPYVAAARLAENVPDDFDRLLKIVYP
jgi:Phosphoenolpyruvate carboxylase